MTYGAHDEYDERLREQDAAVYTPQVSDRDLAIRRLRTQMDERRERIEQELLAARALVEDYIERERAA